MKISLSERFFYEQAGTTFVAPFRFGYPDEFSVFVRYWPQPNIVNRVQFVRIVNDQMDLLPSGYIEDDDHAIGRYRVNISDETTRAETKVEVIRALNDIGYKWTPNMKMFDRVKGRVFCFID